MLKLCIKDLSYSYHNRVKLFSNLSFEVSEGECFYIHGANGTGKTTLLRVLAGLQGTRNGRVFLEGYEKSSLLSCDYLQTETNGLFYNLSAMDNLLFWSRSFGKNASKKAVLNLAEKWGFRNHYTLEKLPVKGFSTGMKKKLALIRIALLEAPVLLLDEPLNGLDEASCELLFEELKALKKRKRIIIMSSHQKLGLYESIIDKRLTL